MSMCLKTGSTFKEFCNCCFILLTVWKKYELQNNYEMNASKKLPFCYEKSILPNIFPFSKIFAKHFP